MQPTMQTVLQLVMDKITKIWVSGFEIAVEKWGLRQVQHLKSVLCSSFAKGGMGKGTT